MNQGDRNYSVTGVFFGNYCYALRFLFSNNIYALSYIVLVQGELWQEYLQYKVTV